MNGKTHKLLKCGFADKALELFNAAAVKTAAAANGSGKSPVNDVAALEAGLKGANMKGPNSKHLDMSQIYENIKKEGYVPRGAGWINGADQYYWFSQVVAGDARYFYNPELVASEPNAFWLSGMMRWMIPLDGKPSPHAIIMGQWEPTDTEAKRGIAPGNGAVSALLFGESECGQRGLPVAVKRTEIFEGILGLLNGDDDSVALDGSGAKWEGKKTILT